VTAEDVARCVRGYLKAERRTVVIAEPEPHGDASDDGDDHGDDHGEDDSDD